MMFFTVIIPVYNVEEYLTTCIDSVLNQGESDLEILLVDDGSTDASGSLCDDYQVSILKSSELSINRMKGYF